MVGKIDHYCSVKLGGEIMPQAKHVLTLLQQWINMLVKQDGRACSTSIKLTTIHWCLKLFAQQNETETKQFQNCWWRPVYQTSDWVCC